MSGGPGGGLRSRLGAPSGRLGTRGYLLLLVALAIVAPFAVYLSLGAILAQTFFSNELTARGEAVVQGVAESATVFLRSAEIFVEAVAMDGQLIRGRQPERLRAHLREELSLDPDFESFTWIDGRGIQLASYPPDPNVDGLDLSDRSFTRIAPGKPFVSDSHISLSSGHPVVTISFRAEPRGDIIVGSLDLSRLSSFVNQAGGPGWRLSILDRSGTIVADRDRRLVTERVNMGDVLPPGGGAGPLRLKVNLGGSAGDRRSIAFAQRLPSYGWHVLASYDEGVLYGLLDRALYLSLAAALVAFGIFGSIALTMARRIVGDLDALRFGVRAIRDRRYGMAGREPSFAEFRELLVDMRTMESAVEEREAQLAGMVRQRDTLLREVHHRVKNNMQIVSSLLSLQKDALEDSAAAAALADSVARVQALALMHEFLYRGGDFASVDLGDYFQELCSFLVSAYGVSGVEVVIDGDKVSLDMDRAIPLGLVMTEIVSNSLKHAFAGRDRGRMAISIAAKEGGVSIEASDDGPGFVPRSEGRSLGLVLIDTLMSQLGGGLTRSSSGGTVYRMVLPRRD
ncbi:MAG TPA: sensor histidine kinase [Rectinemataceae bacterium]|nr:sensor histidine kinase [Rectinemataceae bacterium]